MADKEIIAATLAAGMLPAVERTTREATRTADIVRAVELYADILAELQRRELQPTIAPPVDGMVRIANSGAGRRGPAAGFAPRRRRNRRLEASTSTTDPS
jgi:hypothetical protein